MIQSITLCSRLLDYSYSFNIHSRHLHRPIGRIIYFQYLKSASPFIPACHCRALNFSILSSATCIVQSPVIKVSYYQTKTSLHLLQRLTASRDGVYKINFKEITAYLGNGIILSDKFKPLFVAGAKYVSTKKDVPYWIISNDIFKYTNPLNTFILRNLIPYAAQTGVDFTVCTEFPFKILVPNTEFLREDLNSPQITERILNYKDIIINTLTNELNEQENNGNNQIGV